jgi:hypothetical protein
MKQFKGIGVLVIAIIVIFAIISLLKGGWSGRAPVPAAVGVSEDEERSPAQGPKHLTHHPIIVSPRDVPGEFNPAAASPAAESDWPESPANAPTGTRPVDSFRPSPSFLPLPDRIGTLPDESRPSDWPQWPDGRLPQNPPTTITPDPLNMPYPTWEPPSAPSRSLHR